MQNFRVNFTDLNRIQVEKVKFLIDMTKNAQDLKNAQGLGLREAKTRIVLSARTLERAKNLLREVAFFAKFISEFLDDQISVKFEMTSREALAISTDVKPPVIFKGEYEQWKDIFLDFIDINDLGDYF
ncbi:hypothetical protein L6452_14145 [Arctium lappa]|uniref:Uncharacterized protein n=1 Tax=Arctium lappa TaxID=4217 RepID=A0ACB9CK88_ARCLA|nr:hypothetical protein L6452_14145 [Arctium lappa]